MSTFASFLSLTLLLSSTWVGAALPASNAGPVVKLKYGSFQGNTTGGLVEFLGMPFAAPPYVFYSISIFLFLTTSFSFLKCWESPICSSDIPSEIRWSPPGC